MDMWEVRWHFDRDFYEPESSGTVDFWLENRGTTFLYATECALQFEHQASFNQWWLCQRSVQIRPGQTEFVGRPVFSLPKLVAGTQRYRAFYHVWEFDPNLQQWQDLGFRQTNFEYGINVFPQPVYRAFLSRGIRPEDKLLGEEIAQMVREWGFETTTVGIEVQADPNSLKEIISNEIERSDCLIAIATPRSIDALTGLWRTLEWLHGELGIAFGRDKPILVVRESSVALGGLPGEFQNFTLAFSPFDMHDLKARISSVMPGFRDWIGTKRSQEFLNNLGKVAVGALALIGIGAVASAFDKSSRKSD